MKSSPMKTALAERPYDRAALLSLSDQIVASLRFSQEDKGRMGGACRHLAVALDRCHGRTLEQRWRDFEKTVWPLWANGVNRPVLSGLGVPVCWYRVA